MDSTEPGAHLQEEPLPLRRSAPWVPEALEVARIRSAVGEPLEPGGLCRTPPFRAPHHTASPVALTGGGTGRAGLTYAQCRSLPAASAQTAP
mgnify:CR=1 FL=1